MLYGINGQDKPLHGISIQIFNALAIRPMSTKELSEVKEVKDRYQGDNSLNARLSVLRRERQIELAYFGPLKIPPSELYKRGRPKGRNGIDWKWYLTDFGWKSYTRATFVIRPTHEEVWKLHIGMGRKYNHTEMRPKEKVYTEEQIQEIRERLDAFQALKESGRARSDNQEPEF